MNEAVCAGPTREADLVRALIAIPPTDAGGHLPPWNVLVEASRICGQIYLAQQRSKAAAARLSQAATQLALLDEAALPKSVYAARALTMKWSALYRLQEEARCRQVRSLYHLLEPWAPEDSPLERAARSEDCTIHLRAHLQIEEC